MNIPAGLTLGQALTARREGGIRNVAYLDSRGFWTVGIGCKGPGIIGTTVWTDAQATAEFLLRYAKAEAQAQIDLGTQYWAELDEVRRAVLTDIAYQDGGGNPNTGAGGLAGFHQMLAAVRIGNWTLAAAQCKASANAIQTPARCNENAVMLSNGHWPAWLSAT